MADNNMNNTNGGVPESTNAAPAPVPTPTAPQEPVDMTMKQPIGVEPTSRKSHTLAIVVGVLLLLLALTLGGLYLWGAMLDRQQPEVVLPEENADVMTESETQTDTTSTQNDELSALESDVESTELDAMEAELNQIDAEIEAETKASS